MKKIIGLAMLGAVSCASQPATFDVNGYIVGDVGAPANDIVKGQSCKFYDSTVSVGDPLIIKGADGTILGKGELTASSIDTGPACSFGFNVPGIKAGDAGYSILLDPYDPVIVREDELRSALIINARGPMDILLHPNMKPLTVGK
jgi:hypothetical protein